MLDVEKTVQMYEDGMSYSEISRQLQVPMSQVSGVLSALGIKRDSYVALRLKIWEMRRDGHSLESISEALGTSVANVKSKLNGMKKLKSPVRTQEQDHERNLDQS